MQKSVTDLAVEAWPIENVHPYEGNPRIITEAAISKVAAAINEFGWRQPLVVDKNGVLVVGHARLLAAKRLGLETVPVHVAADLTPEQARAYRLADNRTGEESRWNPGALDLELRELGAVGFNLALTGFDPIELPTLEPQTTEWPELPSGDRPPFQQMTFTLHDEQAANVKAALELAKKEPAPVEGPNRNSNGNALAAICGAYLVAHGRG
ncbi:ParB N-terminal domain-containing protein [Methylocystis sp. JR02]|uniref:ParB N-terminal domain-containing protein n=1 Tax=Methylocystis sp. JR02 TaxID=3046284 RepID=UPI0024BB081D|nr:ParB N-terminal domain-containing protein [Methylocystis sp. JR02]MDJ0449230.1 ParB N-terminal domain-containing protein [Methylocystis sp. JR02]